MERRARLRAWLGLERVGGPAFAPGLAGADPPLPGEGRTADPAAAPGERTGVRVAPPGRVRALAAVVLLGCVILVARLWTLQVWRGHDFLLRAEGNRLRALPILAPRGRILDRFGRPLAVNRLAHTVLVIPEEMGPERPRTVARVAAILGTGPEEIEALLSERPTGPSVPVRLRADASPEAVALLAEAQPDLPGVVVDTEPIRYYPYGEWASHLLGYLGLPTEADLAADPMLRPYQLVGKVGVERLYDAVLRGRDGSRTVEVDAWGRRLRDLGVQDPERGYDIYLTIDRDVQLAAEKALAEQLAVVRKQRAPEAPGGAVVALDPRNGQLLALVSQPGFNPNRLLGDQRGRYFAGLLRDRRKPFLNRALAAYPPGSTFKVITGIAALETGALRPTEVYNATGRGPFGKLDWTLTADPPQPPAGRVTIVGALMRSANDFFWHIALRPGVGITAIARYARLFGLGEPAGFHFVPGESGGLIPDPEWKRLAFRQAPPDQQVWYLSETADVAIGQGFVLATPLQMALVYAAIATRGTIYRPYLLRHVEAPAALARPFMERDGTPTLARRITLKASTWQAIHQGLVAVAQNPRGTAAGAMRGLGVPVAGKTGTAQAAGGKSHGWFAAYAPADRPEIVVVAFVERGTGGAYAAAPVVRKVLEAYFAARR